MVMTASTPKNCVIALFIHYIDKSQIYRLMYLAPVSLYKYTQHCVATKIVLYLNSCNKDKNATSSAKGNPCLIQLKSHY